MPISRQSKPSTIAFAAGGRGYPWKEIWQAYHKLLSYHEHTNGAFSEEDVQPIPFQKDPKAANANYYESEQVMHKRLVREARDFATTARDHAIGQLTHLITTRHDNTVVAFNPLNHARSDLAPLPVEPGRTWHIVDNATGTAVPSQRMPDGKVLFLASDVPSMGYKTYRIVLGDPGRSSPPSAPVQTDVLENAFYKIRIDDSTGAIASIWDKKRSIELVDQESGFAFNQYLYQRIDAPFSRTPTTYRPRMIAKSGFSGPLALGITTKVAATGCHSIEQSVILYRHADRIDFIVNLEKSESGRLLKQTTAQNKEALFYVLPFHTSFDSAGFWWRGGAAAHRFRITSSASDQHFTDLSNSRYGVTMPAQCPWLSTARHAGIVARAEHADSTSRNPPGRVALYLMNNMFFPISALPAGTGIRWSIRAHDGDWVAGRHITAGAASPGSFLIEKTQKVFFPCSTQFCEGRQGKRRLHSSLPKRMERDSFSGSSSWQAFLLTSGWSCPSSILSPVRRKRTWSKPTGTARFLFHGRTRTPSPSAPSASRPSA
jgi:hypothetical protein